MKIVKNNMSCYNEIFETIKSKLVPKEQYEDSQLELEHMRSELKNAKEDLKRIKSKYEEQKLKIDIIQAEKECLESEKKTFELKFNELSLKLKLKTNQYDSLLSSEKTDCESNDTELMSSGTQTVKEEPHEIGIDNNPTSLSSEIGTKRTNSGSDNERKKSKCKKTTRSSSTTRNTRTATHNKRTFTCEVCVYDWGQDIEDNFGGDPNHKGPPCTSVPDPRDRAPDPRQIIKAFPSYEALKNHKTRFHGENVDMLCQEKSCLKYDKHWHHRHGEILCRICDLSFKLQKNLDQHMETDHADHNMLLTKQQFYDLYLKYKEHYQLDYTYNAH